MQQKYIQAIEKEEVLVMIMFGVVSLVAVFLILCIFYMIVQEKTRDVGIIKSVGGSTEGVAAVFLVYGGAIGLVGALLGSLLGTTFVDHINEIQDWLARINPEWRVWSPETYSFDKIPSAWKTWDVVWICILSIFASILGAAFPATRAGRTWPVESLRYE
jgi:lipoprotein-releasing system permease protein